MSIFVAAIDGMTSHDAADVTRLETVFLSAEGVIGITGDDLKVEAQGTPDMTVKVNPGSCFVERDAHVDSDNTLKFWKVIVTVNTNVAIATADPGDDRIDLICVKIDTGATPDANASNVATLVAVAGTPAGSPSRPAVPNNHLEIAQILVGAGVTSIVSGNITDTRSFIGLQLPYAEGYKMKDTAGNLDAKYYEDSDGVVHVKGAKSGGGIEIDQENNTVKILPGGGTDGVVQSSASLEVRAIGKSTDATVEDGIDRFTIPKKLNGMRLARISASVDTAGETNTLDIQIHNVTNGEDLLLTPLTIDSLETSSDTAAAPAVIDQPKSVVAEGDEIRIDIDAVQTTESQGLLVRFEYEL